MSPLSIILLYPVKLYFLQAQKESILEMDIQETILTKYAGGFWCERTSADGLFHWKKHFYALRTHILAKSDGLKFKCINYGFVS